MKKKIVAGILTLVTLTLIKVVLVSCGVKALFFQYAMGDKYTTYYLALNWLLNVAVIVGLYKLIRYIQNRI